jgi:hypothetical protein
MLPGLREVVPAQQFAYRQAADWHPRAAGI